MGRGPDKRPRKRRPTNRQRAALNAHRRRDDNVMVAEFRGLLLTAAQVYQMAGRQLGLTYQAIHHRMRRGAAGEALIHIPRLPLNVFAVDSDRRQTGPIQMARERSDAAIERYRELMRAIPTSDAPAASIAPTFTADSLTIPAAPLAPMPPAYISPEQYKVWLAEQQATMAGALPVVTTSPSQASDPGSPAPVPFNRGWFEEE